MGELSKLISEAFDSLENKNNDEAIIKFKKAILLGDSARFVKYLAYAYSYSKNFEESIKTYNTYLQFYPEDLDARNELAECYLNTQQYDNAKKELEQILEKDSEKTYAKLNLANTYFELNDMKKAEEYYKEITEKDAEKFLRETKALEENLTKLDQGNNRIQRATIIISYSKLAQIYLEQNKKEDCAKTLEALDHFKEETKHIILP